MKVPFLDLGRETTAAQKDAILADVRAVVETGRFIGGPAVERFEAAFAKYCGTRFAIGCGNGLDALQLSLTALGVGPGDEVVVPAHTFLATWLAVSQVGATIAPVDVRADTGCIDPDLLEAAITPRTRAIIVVHLYGHIPDMKRIAEIAAAHSVAMIEDAAQAHGAARDGRRAGAFGRLAAFSFYPVKNLGAWGDAGAITTDDPGLAEQLASLRDYGRTSQHEFGALGVNSRLDPVQAAVLSRKLEWLEAANARRAAIARRYDAALEGKNGLRRLLAPGANCVWHQYVVTAKDRGGFRRWLEEAGIGAAIHYPIPPHRQACYAHLGFDGVAWPVADRLPGQILSLPIGAYLEADEVDWICDAIARY